MTDTTVPATTADHDSPQAGTGSSQWKQWLSLAGLKRVLRIILIIAVGLLALSVVQIDVITVLLLGSGLLMLIGGRTTPLDRRYRTLLQQQETEYQWLRQRHVAKVVRLNLLEGISLVLLILALLWGVLNLLATASLDVEPAYGIIVTVLFIGSFTARFVDKSVLLVGLAVCVGFLAYTKLQGNEWFVDLLKNGVSLLPTMGWLILVLLLALMVVGWVRYLRKVGLVSALVLAVLFVMLFLEVQAFLIDFRLSGVSYGFDCYGDSATLREIQRGGVCPKDGPDFWVQLFRLLGVASIGALIVVTRLRQPIPATSSADPDANPEDGAEPDPEDDLDGPDTDTWNVLEALYAEDQKARVLRKDGQGFMAQAQSRVMRRYPDLATRLTDQAMVDQYVAYRRNRIIETLRTEQLTNNLIGKHNQFLKRRLDATFPPRGKEFVDDAGITPQDLS